MSMYENDSFAENVHELKSKLNEREQELSEFEGKLSKAMRELEELQKSKTRIYTEFVTILGIFTTIVFASFGGFSILRNVLGNLADVRKDSGLLLYV